MHYLAAVQLDDGRFAVTPEIYSESEAEALDREMITVGGKQMPLRFIPITIPIDDLQATDIDPDAAEAIVTVKIRRKAFSVVG